MRKVSESTIKRLSVYYRILEACEADGIDVVSSKDIANRMGGTPDQIRRDLFYFGNFGKKGVGYYVIDLKRVIGNILGINRNWNVAIVGAGNLGHALFHYEEFARKGFDIVAVFDKDPTIIGKRWENVTIQPMEEMFKTVNRLGIEIMISAVPPAAAQGVIDQVINTGVKAILNFSPRKVFVPPDVKVRNVSMSVEIESLSYFLSRRRQ